MHCILICKLLNVQTHIYLKKCLYLTKLLVKLSVQMENYLVKTSKPLKYEWNRMQISEFKLLDMLNY